ncbi:glycosyl transferase group 2 [Candidatus Termititenax persephonae]|uniref:Glycosyl transferase group 2 n=1 Tax=Candidatus Termititenax persephonae TaxID=2218525 RepID=A0A388TEQ3_9BACT|nr:glycosyl transferase group 2 [Candidatus Termititenax persephonae]
MSCLVSVVLGSYNRRKFLPRCLDSVRRELADVPHEIIVVDGGSTDGSLSWLVKQKDILTIVQHNRGSWRGRPVRRRSWGYFMNLGFKAAQGKYICMLSDDCLVVPGAVKKGLALFERKRRARQKIGALAFYWRDWPVENFYAVYAFAGGVLNVNHGLYLRAALQEIGFLDEETYRFYAGDIDVCLQLAAAGYKIIPAENSYIEHYAHANFRARFANNKQNQERDKRALIKKWSFKYGTNPENYARQTWPKDFHDSTRTIRKFYLWHFLNGWEYLLWAYKFCRKTFAKGSVG